MIVNEAVPFFAVKDTQARASSVAMRRHLPQQDYSQRETYYLVETCLFEPVMDEEAAPAETSAFREFRWWSIEGIGGSAEAFAPRRLHELLKRMAINGPPVETIEAGI